MIKKIDVSDIPERQHKNGRKGYAKGEIQKFLDQGFTVGEIEFSGKYKNANSAYSSYCYAVNTNDLPVVLFRREGRIFIVRKDCDIDC